MKGCGFADARPQRIYTTKIESSSHMATLAGTMMTCVIDAYEGKDVAAVDPPGVFLQTIMPKDKRDVHVILEGWITEFLAKIAPEVYQEYKHHKKGQSYLYCKLNVALYGTIKAALLCALAIRMWMAISVQLCGMYMI